MPNSAPYSWLLRLYPPAWRRRYGDELAALLAEEAKLSPSAVVDLLGGALDAWVSPQPNLSLQPVRPEEGVSKMTARWMTCTRGDSQLTLRESLIGAGVILLATFLLSTASLLLKRAYGNVPAVAALGHSLFPVLMVLTANALYLQRRSWRAQAAFVFFFSAVVYLILLGASGFAAAH